jgi:hypothetical protein
MYGFGYTTDLGKRVFYFSFINKSSKVYTFFVEIVVLVTQSIAKLVLQFLDFPTIWYWIYNSLNQKVKAGRIYLHSGPWNFWNLRDKPSTFAHSPSGKDPLHNLTLPRWSKLAGGEGGPEEANKRPGSSLGLTRGQLVSETWPGNNPVMAAGEAAAAPPRRRGSRRNERGS